MDTDIYNALMGAILAEPAADLPRLVLADFLEESGRPEFGEFIRIQVEIAATSPTAIRTDLGHVGELYYPLSPLNERQWKLLLEFGREWFGDTSLWVDGDRPDSASPHAPGLVVGRGFPHAARGPLGWWCGGECEGCGGRGVREIDSSDVYGGSILDRIPCMWCHGSGRTPANGPELVRKWPLAAVRATGSEPLFFRTDTDDPEEGDWCWVVPSPVMIGADVESATHLLPPDLWELLTEFDTSPSARVRAKRYPSRKRADDALSEALLSWAKSQPVAV